jgi:hypothetical protein
MVACASGPLGRSAARDQSGADPAITAFIEKIHAVDNHAHANSVMPGDSDADALPLDGIAPFELPVRLRPDHPDVLAAYKALYQYPHQDLNATHLSDLRSTMQARAQGRTFPNGCSIKSERRCCSPIGLPWARVSRHRAFDGFPTRMR